MSRLNVMQLNPHFGVEISGLEPCVPLAAGTVAELRSIFDSNGLILFRNLDADLEFQDYLSQLLIGGEDRTGREPHNEIQPPRREMLVSNKVENGAAPYGRLLYHSDRMWSPDVFRLLSLYGVEVNEPSVPTLFVSIESAWKTLPDDLRAQVEGRFAVHGHDATYGDRAGDEEVLISTFEKDEEVRLPIAFSHPRTGKTLLYVSEMFTQRIEGMPREESEILLRSLFEHIYAEGNVVTHHWRKGDLVLWDNIALQHARPNVSLAGPPRTLRKVFAPPPEITLTQRPKFKKLGSSAASR